MQKPPMILDYLATYPNDGIMYHASDMILAAHSDAVFHNKSIGRRQPGAQIFLSEDDPIPPWNGRILSIAQVIKFIMNSATESELAALYITAQKLVTTRQTLTEMGWPQLTTPIQTDNTTEEGAVNNKIVTQKKKFMDLIPHCLRCQEAQKQFRFY